MARTHNKETEQEVLSRLIHNPELMKETYGQISSEDFYDFKAKDIYQLLISRYEKKKSWDFVLITDELSPKERYFEYLLYIPVSIGVNEFKEHLSNLKKRAIQRQIYETGVSIQQQAFEDDPKILLSETLQKISEVEIRLNSTAQWELSEIINRHSKLMDDRISGTSIGITSGFKDLDYLLGNGFQRKDLIVLGARPSVGKTSFALTMAYNAAKNNSKVLFITLEMDDQELFDRLLSFEIKIPVTTIIRGKVIKEVIEKGYESIRQLPLSILHLSEATSGDIHAIAARHKYTKGLDLLIVDYLGYLSDRSDDEVNQLGRISKGLKTTANLLDCAVLAPHQLNRKIELRSKKDREAPLLSDLRDSGHIEQDADVVMFLNRDIIGEHPERASLRIGKHRTGSTGILDLTFNINTTRFE